MSIRFKRTGFIVLLGIGIIEALILSNGAIVSMSTVLGIFVLYFVMHLLGIKIGKDEKSLYIKDLSSKEKIFAVFSFILIIIWVAVVALQL